MVLDYLTIKHKIIIFISLCILSASIGFQVKEYMDSLEIELYNVKQLKNTYNPYNDQVMP